MFVMTYSIIILAFVDLSDSFILKMFSIVR